MNMLAIALLVFAQSSVEVDKDGTVKLKSDDGKSLTIKADVDEDETEGGSLDIVQNHQKIKEHCDGKTPVEITGNHNRITLTGECKSVLVTGNHNTITIARALGLELTGNENEIAVAEIGAIEIPGNNNSVKWKNGLAPKKDPRIEKIGNKNSVVREK